MLEKNKNIEKKSHWRLLEEETVIKFLSKVKLFQRLPKEPISSFPVKFRP